jgi:Ca2+-binding RTX toxin-like protein
MKWMIGSFGNDTIVGGLGADVIFTGSGNDVVRFLNLSEGGDTIRDFADTFDRLDISRAVADNFSALTVTQQGANTIVSVGSTILATLINFAAGNFTVADVTFF